jgi:hypothetical protein
VLVSYGVYEHSVHQLSHAVHLQGFSIQVPQMLSPLETGKLRKSNSGTRQNVRQSGKVCLKRLKILPELLR